MCGIFGFVAQDDNRVSLKRLKEIAIATEARGHHAFGFAWIDRQGRMKSYKQTGRISHNIRLLGMLSEATALIGHCRFATQGDYQNNLNNHPFPCDGGWLAHNGTIPEYREVLDQWGLYPVTDCDSETLALLVERMDGDILDRCADAMNEIACPAVLLGLWKSPDRLVVARRRNPVHLAVMDEGVYVASLGGGMPRWVLPMEDGEIKVFTRTSEGTINVETAQLNPQNAASEVASLF